MNRTLLTYSGFGLACLAVVVAFVTATTYMQLGIAILLYMPLTYFAFKTFTTRGQGGSVKNPLLTIQVPAKTSEKVREQESERKKVDVADIDKRTFLKLIGATGLSFFVFSLLGRRVDTLLFGNAPGSSINSTGPANTNTQTPQAGSIADGYKITDIDDSIVSYYGFTNQDGAWFIMKQDTKTGAYRYAKGETGFSGNWAVRDKLSYDYYYELF